MNARSNRLNRNGATLAMAGCLALLSAASTMAESPRIPHHRKQPLAAHASNRVLVKVAPSRATAMKAKASGSSLPGISELKPLHSHNRTQAAKMNDVPRWHVAQLNAGADVAQVIEALSNHAEVSNVEPDYLIAAPRPVSAHHQASMAATSDPDSGEQYAIEKLALPQAWTQQAGSRNVIVAVIDTGVQLDHPDLVNQLWFNATEELNNIDDDQNGHVDDVVGWNFSASTNNSFDGNGHGTHVAGIIAATRNNNIGIAGAANVSIMPIKVLDDSGNGAISDTMEGIVYAVNNGASIINMSLGSAHFSQAYSDLCDEAAAADVLIFAASGNEYASAVGFPAGYASVVAVGATDQQDMRADFSNTGRDIELVAPGVEILSTWPGAMYNTIGGTSMACPYAAGVAALIRSAFPNMTAAAVRARMNGTVDDLGAPGYDTQFGFGRVNAMRALTESGDATMPGGGGGNGQADDEMEENDTPADAREISVGEHSLEGLDQDWFRFKLTGSSSITLKLEGPEGDLDLWLYRVGEFEPIAKSIDAGSLEEIARALDAGDYLIAIEPFEGAASHYMLRFGVTQTTPTPPGPTPTINIVCGQTSPLPMMGLMLGLMGMGSSLRRVSRQNRR